MLCSQLPHFATTRLLDTIRTTATPATLCLLPTTHDTYASPANHATFLYLLHWAYCSSTCSNCHQCNLSADYRLEAVIQSNTRPRRDGRSSSPHRRSRRNRSRSSLPQRGSRCNQSRSRSPTHKYSDNRADRRSRYRRRSPGGSRQVFPQGADPAPRSVCAVCLGRFPHRIQFCESNQLWDKKTDAFVHRRDGNLIAPNGRTVCKDFQRPDGCQMRSHDQNHRCSGCGKPDHGAQACPRAQKI